MRVASVLREMSAPARGVYELVLHDPTNFPSDMTLLGFVRIRPQFVYIPRVILPLLKSFVQKTGIDFDFESHSALVTEVDGLVGDALSVVVHDGFPVVT